MSFVEASVSHLPAWVQRITYRADDETTWLFVRVPESPYGVPAHVAALPMDVVELRALRAALDACISQSEKNSTVIDVPSRPA